MIFYLFAVLVLLAGTRVHAAPIEQKTEGWCSPAVADTQGNVTITCQGVDPKALQRLNELLDKKDLELQAKIREAEDWARKYREVSQRLETEGQDTALARQARALLAEGKLAEAGALLDRLLAEGEAEVERMASHHFSRGQVFELQFKLQEAVPHYAKAYQYRPENPQYGLAYADALQGQNRYREAEPIYEATLTLLRQLAKDNPAAYQPDVATTLNNLGTLYSGTQQLQQAEQVYQEALTTYRQLAKDNPAAYQPDVATTLNNLGILYFQQDRIEQAKSLIEESLTIHRALWTKNPMAYGEDLARSLMSQAVLLRNKKNGEPAVICDTIREALHVASGPDLKQYIQQELKETACVPAGP